MWVDGKNSNVLMKKYYIKGIFQGEYYYKKSTCLISNKRNNWL